LNYRGSFVNTGEAARKVADFKKMRGKQWYNCRQIKSEPLTVAKLFASS
jgi:hypothetical protein